MTLVGTRCCWAFVALLLCAGRAFGAYPCEASPEIAAAIDALPDIRDFRLSFEQRFGPRRELLKRFPSDIFVHQTWQDSFRETFQLSELRDRAFAEYTGHPNDPLMLYLEARLRFPFQLRKAEALLDAAILRDPAFAWPHLVYVEIAELPGHRDVAKAETHMRAFLKLCPNALEAYSHFQSIEDPAMLREAATRFRALIQALPPEKSVRYYPALWTLEDRTAPKPDRVRGDIERLLATAPPHPTTQWYWTVRKASEVTGDRGLLQRFEDAELARSPESPLALSITESRWNQAHLPPRSATPEDFQKYDRALRSAQAEWRKRWPDSPSLLQQRFLGLLVGADLPLDEELSVVDAYAGFCRRNPEFGFSVPPVEIAIAERYIRRGVRLDQVQGLVEEGIRKIEQQEKYRIGSDLFLPEAEARSIDGVALTRLRGQIRMVEYFLATKEPEKAREVSVRALAAQDARIAATANERDKRQAEYWRGEILAYLAEAEEAGGDKQAALAHYRESLRHLPRQTLEQDQYAPVKAARRLYLETGGNPNHWLDWVGSGPPQSRLVGFTKTLPEFTARDLSGRLWRLSELKGKATFVNVWATWCGPCRGEHPDIQALLERLRGRKDLQVITISVDDSPAPVETYIKENGYTFPVVVSRDLAEKIFPVIAVPQNWIIDRQGRRSEEMWPGGGERWVERIVTEMEKAAGAR